MESPGVLTGQTPNTTNNEPLLGSHHQPPAVPSDIEVSDDSAISLDTRKLQAQHTTEGYRDGITNGKADHLQGGFDEGFGLGATIGLSAGRLLGLLEGLVASFSEIGVDSPPQITHLLSEATGDLSETLIFAKEYWGHDGTWKYPVDEAASKDEGLFETVARRHPTIAKWTEEIDSRVLKEIH
ncbi:hypothetical protein F4820DRAFT_252747 [Hypoxylon rubiginosum]|uniref:Uncharacterized protein n=1 Tax=Hypoxylon rubiginosum TaxID=110542 RepID=A0ACB9ZFG7_9PEZI|nr:hypothetical protein F4820DRAFT_252747 [Hypoxylon rubiginosum]